jgi:hypothetical protein
VTARGSHGEPSPLMALPSVALQSGTSLSMLLRGAGPTREPQKAGAVLSRKGPCAGLLDPRAYTQTPSGRGP